MDELLDQGAVEALRDEVLRAIGHATSTADLEAVEQSAMGRSSRLLEWRKQLGALDAQLRRDLGRVLNETREAILAALEQRRGELERLERIERLAADRLMLDELYDLAVPAPIERGHRHLSTSARDELEDVFVSMGFSVAEGPEVETDWYNFEALNIPPGHPARGMHDTIYLEVGDVESVVMRTHTSPVQIRLMERAVREGTLPLHVVIPGRVFRNDTPDASHLVAFHQIEGLVVDEGITFADLAGTIEAFTRAYFGADMRARLRPSFFPFTEPSAEFDITCAICRGEGCRTCQQTGWVELGGCGVVDPAVFAAVGIDSTRWSGFAFGFGIDRLALMRHSVADVRALIENDVRFLRQF